MSARLRLDAGDLRNLATALDDLTTSRARTGVELSGYPASVRVADVEIEVAWDGEAEEYVTNDRIGG